MNSLSPNSLKKKKIGENPLDDSGMTEIKSHMIIKWEVTNRCKGLDLIDRVPEEL